MSHSKIRLGRENRKLGIGSHVCMVSSRKRFGGGEAIKEGQ